MTLCGGGDNFFEDFRVGDRVRHWRGKTITDYETQTLSMLVMNTSAGHFDAHAMSKTEFASPVVFGGIVASILIGLSSQDTAEHVTEELGIDQVDFHRPTRTGDTLYAVTEVLDTEVGADESSGWVRFRHVAVNQNGEAVCTIVRRAAIERRNRLDHRPGIPATRKTAS